MSSELSAARSLASSAKQLWPWGHCTRPRHSWGVTESARQARWSTSKASSSRSPVVVSLDHARTRRIWSATPRGTSLPSSKLICAPPPRLWARLRQR